MSELENRAAILKRQIEAKDAAGLADSLRNITARVTQPGLSEKDAWLALQAQATAAQIKES